MAIRKLNFNGAFHATKQPNGRQLPRALDIASKLQRKPRAAVRTIAQ
jgi:hypothetical protein